LLFITPLRSSDSRRVDGRIGITYPPDSAEAKALPDVSELNRQRKEELRSLGATSFEGVYVDENGEVVSI